MLARDTLGDPQIAEGAQDRRAVGGLQGAAAALGGGVADALGGVELQAEGGSEGLRNRPSRVNVLYALVSSAGARWRKPRTGSRAWPPSPSALTSLGIL